MSTRQDVENLINLPCEAITEQMVEEYRLQMNRAHDERKRLHQVTVNAQLASHYNEWDYATAHEVESHYYFHTYCNCESMFYISFRKFNFGY